MKAKLYKTSATILLTAIFSITSVFAGNSIKGYYGNKNFHFEENADLIHVEINKKPWECFTFAIDNVEVMNNPVVNFEVLASEFVNLRVDLTDGLFMSSEVGLLQTSIQKTSAFQTITFDFSEMISNIDLSENVFLVIYVNPGENFSGEISIKNFKLSPSELSGNEDAIQSGFAIYPSPATSFTNVEIPDNGINTLRIFDMNGKEIISANVDFYSGMTYYVELSNIPAGYYTVQLSGANVVLTEKLIVR